MSYIKTVKNFFKLQYKSWREMKEVKSFLDGTMKSVANILNSKKR